jgi:putative DNA primase/helicase
MADREKSVWTPVLPVPDDAPPARVRHNDRGDPLRVFSYHDADGQLLGHVCRFISSTGEPLHMPLTWCRDQHEVRTWRWKQFERFRPLYNLDGMAVADESDGVLLVFDEHSAEHAKRLVPWLTPVSWPGGVKNIDEVDWSPLKGRMVFIWPTLERKHAQVRHAKADIPAHALPRDRQPMWRAALKLERIVIGLGGAVISIIDPWPDADRPEGFDAGMAGMQDWTPEQTQAWMEAHMGTGLGSEWSQKVRRARGELVAPEAPPAAASEPISTPFEANASEAVKRIWVEDLLYKNGDLAACLHNVHQILANRPEWAGVVALDEFSLKVVKRKFPPFEGGAIGEWTDADASRTAMWLQREYGFTPSSSLAQEAVGVLADGNRFHPVRNWMQSLKWDGTERIAHWLIDFLGADDCDYSRHVGKWWLMGAVARAMKPGCKFDYVLVLEGLQGKKKSSAFDALGGEWFGDNDLDFANKDSMLALQGKLIYEIAELGALARSDERKQKSFLSRRFDEFRPPYGRGFVRVPRQLVFCGTTNEWEWNKDPTGGRRFWPIPCKVDEIDVAGIAGVRDQLFAEALHCFEAGDRYWPTADEQKRLFDPEQLKIEQPDAFVDALHDWVYGRVALFSLAEAAMDGLKMDASKLTRDIQTRIGTALRKLGCSRVEKRNGMTRFWYKPPQESAKYVTSRPAQQDDEVSHVPF